MIYGCEMVKYYLMSSCCIYTSHDNLIHVMIRQHMIKIL